MLCCNFLCCCSRTNLGMIGKLWPIAIVPSPFSKFSVEGCSSVFRCVFSTHLFKMDIYDSSLTLLIFHEDTHCQKNGNKPAKPHSTYRFFDLKCEAPRRNKSKQNSSIDARVSHFFSLPYSLAYWHRKRRKYLKQTLSIGTQY